MDVSQIIERARRLLASDTSQDDSKISGDDPELMPQAEASSVSNCHLKSALDLFAQGYDPSGAGADYPHYTNLPRKLGAYGAAIYLTAPAEMRRKRSQIWDYIWNEIYREQAPVIAAYLKETSEKTQASEKTILDKLRDKTLEWVPKHIQDRYQPYRKALDGTIERAVAYFREGRHGMYWYKGVYEYAEQIFGPGPEGADLFLGILAATSPQAAVFDNVVYALKAWEEHNLDLGWGSVSSWSKTPNIKPNLNRIVENKPLSGPKVYNFRKALMGDPTAVTIDRWMVRALLGEGTEGHDQTSISDTDYFFLDQLTRFVANQINAQPIDTDLPAIVSYAEAQAAVWAGARMDYGQSDPRSRDLGRGIDYVPDLMPPLIQQAYERNPRFWQEIMNRVEATPTPQLPSDSWTNQQDTAPEDLGGIFDFGDDTQQSQSPGSRWRSS